MALSLAPEPSRAASLPTDPDQIGRVRLIAATTAVGDLAALPLGLEFQLAPGWKTYWRSPGDAGYPPRLDWSGSGNLAQARVKWPIPERFSVLDLETLGYEGTAVLPIAAELAEKGKPARFRLQLDWLVCKEVCIPLSAALALDLPRGPAKPSADAHEIDRFNARVPSPATGVGLAVEAVETEGQGAAARVIVHALAEPGLISPDVLIEGPAAFGFGRPRVALAEGGRRATLTVNASGPDGAGLAGETLLLTLVDGDRALETTQLAHASTGTEASLAVMLLVALLGGLVLNLMPCVLPVLSLELLQLAGHGGAERGRTRVAFLASAAGIVFSFLLLAAGAVLLKRAGMAVGWGMQFQEPSFLVFMVLVLALFAANLAGLFEMRLPGFLADRLVFRHGSGPGRHFLTGAFATLLATPCSAPFLGTAIGFALSQGPTEIASIFLALGLGLASPHLALAAFPGLVTRLPRPGAWMRWLERVLAAALAGTALWLVSVLASEAGGMAALVALALILAATASIILLPVRIAAAASAALFATALIAPSRLEFQPPTTAAAESGLRWQAFDRAQLSRLLGEGKVVLVDVTADWCLTCQVNKRLVLGTDAVRRRLEQPGVVALRADWTRPDAAIAEYLASNGRYGIPFNAVYGPGAPDGVLLPELLSEAAVIQAFERAGPPKLAAVGWERQ